ncbi:tonB dependent receptor family protein [Asticcacaulis biprosthecium C19]|uniref:TonB dependent receptor family protein n=1 Tax=Asticcacaulis biprosthecium C19 TaxID=715226 RepID=F4QT28_9CAUL|nr:TonB-dependent receptor [Asticcacaulis biprosthecium]EGF89898.1 tonB dependent receptor family protein [Asticcacaulis biprosthecium C19]
MKQKSLRSGLLATTTIRGILSGVAGLAIAVAAMPAAAQDAAAAAPAADEPAAEVVITGSIIRRKNLVSNSPLTVITAGDLEARGITTTQDVAQRLPGNNGGTMTNNWSANGNFAAGASAISLRGLTSNSTLVLTDGLRLSYYPLADDATRNFVDLNTIPSAIIDRVEVLGDGASSTYGADAIAGVVNIITKKQFQGFTAKGFVGTSEQGGADQRGISAIWGTGSLAEDGWNFYVSGEYQKDDMLKFSERGYPYNTADQSDTCNAVSCRTNGVQNGIQFDNRFLGVGTTTVATVRPYNAAATAVAGSWRILNQADGCRDLDTVTISQANIDANAAAGAPVGGVPVGTKLCQQDNINKYSVAIPEVDRTSFSARFTKRFSDTLEGYGSLTLYNSKTYNETRPRSARDQATPGAAGTTYSTAAGSADFPGAFGLYLPIYVCPRGTTVACTSTNGTLNPNNPFAASNQVARLSYYFGDIPYFTTTDSKTTRFAAGLQGESMGWDWDLGISGMETSLEYAQHGRLYIQHLIDVVKDGSYNFVNPSQNTQAVRDYLSPTKIQDSKSQTAAIHFSAARPLMELAGGTLQLGVGADIRYEMVDNPSANPDPVGGDPRQRYFTINPFGAKGQRTVAAAFFELDAPLTSNWEVNFSGRYDDYSTGFGAFSPKISSKFKANDKLAFRGTLSKGFRAPAIAETNADPSTGFITLSAPDDFIAAHNNNGYGDPYSVGLTTVSSTTLKPEKSESASAGFVFTPTRNLSFTFDWWKIHKDDIIQGGDYAPALDAYFAGQPIPAGFNVVPGQADPNFPNLLPTPGFIQYGLINLSAQDIAGVDVSASGRFDLGFAKLTSTAEASYIQYFTQTYPSGTKARYDGTLGNNQITSGSGTPKLRGNWQSTLDFGKASVTATAYYTSGYKSIAADNGDDYYGTCEEGHTAATYRNGDVITCNVDAFTYIDLHGEYQLTDNYSVQLDILNAFDAAAPQDPSSTYQITNYNVAFHSPGLVGRYVKLTGKVTF